jgi:hypothetical protein
LQQLDKIRSNGNNGQVNQHKEIVMLNREVLIKEIESMPEPLLEEVMDFIRFVKGKTIREGVYTAIASETSLEKDWLCAEEDEAWGDL